jgi:superoxide dismutase, Fe-Mn family
MPRPEVSRREALATGAAGLAALSLSPAQAVSSLGGPAMQDAKPAAAPAAPYTARDYSGLIGIPGFSKAMLENHFTLYQGYVKNTNSVIASLDEHLKNNSLATPAASELRRRFGWEFNGMRLHELYFENLGAGKEPISKDSKVAQKITTTFGSIEAWDKDFRAAAAMRGIGWVALVQDTWTNRVFNTWINEHDVGVLGACPIILIMDVFEHAYMTDYGIKRADYIEAFMKSINWPNVEKRS